MALDGKSLQEYPVNAGTPQGSIFGPTLLQEKSSFKVLGLTFSSKLYWDSYIFSIAKTAPKKIGALIRSMKLLSPEVALYLYKFTIRPCMEYYCHVWAGAPNCYLELLDGSTWNSRGRPTCYSDRMHDFSVTISRYYKDVYVNSFFPRIARLWNSLPIECFLLAYDLNGFKSRINRHLLTVGSF